MFGYAYDAAGNLLSDGLNVMTWDAESRMTSTGGATYIYDADGNRVGKQGIGATDTIYFGGRPIARLTSGQWTDLIYGPNGLLAEVPGTETGAPNYRLLDHLGTEVGTVSSNGILTNPLDYTPFGQVFSGSTNDPYFFTGKERDAESGLDYFESRYYGSSMGRFMSPDTLGGHLEDPQTLNHYSYVGNNPLSRTDPDGHDFYQQCGTSDHSGCAQVNTDPQNSKSTQWVQAGADGKATIITSDSIRAGQNSATMTQNGLQVNGAQGIYFDNAASHSTDANGNDVNHNTLDIAGSGQLQGFNFHVDGNCGGTCMSAGEWSAPGMSSAQAREALNANSFTIPFENVLSESGSRFSDHQYSTQYRFGGSMFGCALSSCPNTPHLSVPFDTVPFPKATVPASGGWHVDAHSGWSAHSQDIQNTH